MDVVERIVARTMDRNRDGRLQSTEMIQFDLEMVAADAMALDATGHIRDTRRFAMYADMTVAIYQQGAQKVAQRTDLWPNGVEIPSRQESQDVVDAMHWVASRSSEQDAVPLPRRLRAVAGLLSDNLRANANLVGSAFSLALDRFR